MNEERIKLIKEIQKQHWSYDKEIGCDYSKEIADFILQNRIRIVEPLIKFYAQKSIDQALKGESIYVYGQKYIKDKS